MWLYTAQTGCPTASEWRQRRPRRLEPQERDGGSAAVASSPSTHTLTVPSPLAEDNVIDPVCVVFHGTHILRALGGGEGKGEELREGEGEEEKVGRGGEGRGRWETEEGKERRGGEGRGGKGNYR